MIILINKTTSREVVLLCKQLIHKIKKDLILNFVLNLFILFGGDDGTRTRVQE